jgi:zinc protease
MTMRYSRGLVFGTMVGAMGFAPAAFAQTYPTTAPAPAPVKPAALPPFQETTLTNGVRVVLVENHQNPVIAFRLAIPAGDAYDPKDKSGTASIVATLLTKGAGKRSADEIAAAIESAGGSLGAFTDEDFLSVSGNVLSNAAPLAFELLGDAVGRPTFVDSEFELARTQTLSNLQLAASNPSAIGDRIFANGLYGKHPYGRTATAGSVRAITRADLVSYQSLRLKPVGAVLVVAGDITLPALRALAEKGFAGWKGAPAAAPVMPAPPVRSATEIVLVHRPGSVQSNVLVGNLALGPADPRRFAALIGNRILGGESDSRLFVVLREQKSWTYGAYSRLTRVRGIGRFEANTEVRTEVTDSALVEMLSQLKKISDPIDAKELEPARNALVGAFPLTIETPQQLAERVAAVKLYGLAPDYLQTYRTRMSAVTGAQVQAALKAVVRPSQALVVVVGDGTKIYDKLKAVGPVKIVSVDGDPMTPADFTPKAMGLALDFSKLVARRDSFVVMVQGNALGSSVYALEKSAGGWTVRESTNVMNGMMTQQTTLESDASLNATLLKQTGSMQGQALKTDITFAGGKATGSATSVTQTGPKTITVDAALPAGTLESDALIYAVSLFRWAADAKFTVNTFNAGKGTVEPVTLTVVGSETVTVPAGTFDTWKIEQKGGENAAILYVTKDAAHRIVKLAPVGQPIELVLAK